MDLYRTTEPDLKLVMDQALQDNKLRYRYKEIDLTHLNQAKFARIQQRFGRKFSSNEMKNFMDGKSS